jgi:hypothetical protein
MEMSLFSHNVGLFTIMKMEAKLSSENSEAAYTQHGRRKCNQYVSKFRAHSAVSYSKRQRSSGMESA